MTAQNSITSQPGSQRPAQAAPPGYAEARSGAAFFDRSGEGRLRLTGNDRTSWLQGLLTNDIAALVPGRGCYAAYLTPQGRMVSDVRVLALATAFLLDLPPSTVSAVRDRFELFVITEDVRVEDVTAAVGRLAVHGPAAARTVAAALGSLGAIDPGGGHLAPAGPLEQRLARLEEHESIALDVSGLALPPDASSPALVVAGARELGGPGFDLYTPAATLPTLVAALDRAGAIAADARAWNVLRLEAGTPVFGADMDESTIPLEAGLEERAISFTKGCYVGQEVIVRVMHRGHGRVARRLVGLTTAEPAPSVSALPFAPGATLLHAAEERDIGRVTSAAFSPALGAPIALGYVHRDFVETGTIVRVRSDSGPSALVVSPTPFLR